MCRRGLIGMAVPALFTLFMRLCCVSVIEGYFQPLMRSHQGLGCHVPWSGICMGEV